MPTRSPEIVIKLVRDWIERRFQVVFVCADNFSSRDEAVGIRKGHILPEKQTSKKIDTVIKPCFVARVILPDDQNFALIQAKHQFWPSCVWIDRPWKQAAGSGGKWKRLARSNKARATKKGALSGTSRGLKNWRVNKKHWMVSSSLYPPLSELVRLLPWLLFLRRSSWGWQPTKTRPEYSSIE